MTFDLATLMAVGVLTTAIAALLTVLAWIADRRARALMWWAAGYGAMALGIGCLLAGNLDPYHAWTVAGAVLLTLGPALIWSGARLLGQRRPIPIAIAAGPLLTLGAIVAEAVVGQYPVAAVVQFAASAIYLTLTALALRPCARAGLRSATPLAAFVALHALMFLIGLVESLMDLLPRSGFVSFETLFGAVHFEQLLFAMGSSIFLVALVRERSEQRYKATAEIDTLTGVATRRAFMDRARHSLATALDRAEPFTLMMFDLDNFKRINDTFGHAVGDEVLRSFAAAARGRLRANDLIGRLGGEEFAVIMPGSSPRAAAVVADRIRRAFAESGIMAAGESVRTTLSGGIATAAPDMMLEQLLSIADAALYRAKAQGRDRIAFAGQRTDEDSVVIRVA